VSRDDHFYQERRAMNEFITLKGFGTGHVTTRKTRRESLVFDLTEIEFSKTRGMAAILDLPARRVSPSTLRLCDPSGNTLYGEAVRQSIDGTLHVSLSSDALADLAKASGSLFSLDVVYDEQSAPFVASTLATAPQLRLTGVTRAHMNHRAA
jgi:hypothetical protein